MASTLPEIRREDGMLVGRDHFRSHRWRLRHKLLDWTSFLLCLLVGHDWGYWWCDDMEGPGEPMEGGGWMPYCSREAHPGEWALRHCARCHLGETRWPEEEAPMLWKSKLRWEEEGRPSSTMRPRNYFDGRPR